MDRTPGEVRDRVLTVPNALSVLRLLLVPVFLYLLFGIHANAWAVAVLMFSGFSDWADGKIARLVPNQSSEKITEMLLQYFRKIAPAGVEVNAYNLHGGEPYMTPIDSKAYQSAAKAIETTFGKKPIPVRGGGSIPICSILEKELGVKIVFMGFGLDSDNLHSPNEKFDLVNFYKGIETIPYFHKYFAS